MSQDTNYPQVSTVTEASQGTVSGKGSPEPSQAQLVESAATSTSLALAGASEPPMAAQDVVSSIPPPQLVSASSGVGVGVVQPHTVPLESALSSSEELPNVQAVASSFATSQVTISSSECAVSGQLDVPMLQSSDMPQATPSDLTGAQLGGDRDSPVSANQGSGVDSSESLGSSTSETQPVSATDTFEQGVAEPEEEMMEEEEEEEMEDGGERMEEEEGEGGEDGTEGQEEAIMEMADTTQTEGVCVCM